MSDQTTPPIVVLCLMKHLVGINAHTGQRVWEVESIPAGPIQIEYGRVVYVASGGGIVCLDYLTGAQLWKAAAPGRMGISGVLLLLYAGCVIATGMGEAVCFNLQNGAQLWHDPFKGYGSSTGATAA